MTLLKILPFLLMALVAQAQDVALQKINCRDFGAKGDGITNDTAAVQRALDAAGQLNGGAMVEVPAGTFQVGTLFLRSNLTLHLDEGATLAGSNSADDYPDVGGMMEGTGQTCNHALILGKDLHHIRLEGPGKIKCLGPDRWFAANQGKGRPFMLRIQNCQDVTLTGLTLEQSPFWCCHLWQSDRVTIDSVTINDSGANSDGIDIDASSHVTIRNSHIVSGDDAICFKSTVNRPCHDVTVSGCDMTTPWNGFKIGTESVGDFENITMTDCVFNCSGGGGIRIYSVDGAHIRHVRLENITFQQADVPIYLRLGARLKAFVAGEPKREVGTLSDVVIRNVHGMTHGTTGLFLTGIPGHPITGVTVDQLDCTTPGGNDGGKLNQPLEEKIDAYPEPCTIFGPAPAYGMVLRHVENSTFRHVKITCAAPDQRPAVACIDVKQVTLDEPQFVNPSTTPSPELWLQQTTAQDLMLKGWQPRLRP